MSLWLGVLGSSLLQVGDFESIATVTAGGATSSIQFTSIPGTYQHLQIRMTARSNYSGNNSNQNLYVRFNTDAGSNYTRHILYVQDASFGFTGSASTAQAFAGAIPKSTHPASLFGCSIIDILDYAVTTKNTTVRTFNGYDTNGSANGTERLCIESGLWMNVNAVTSIQITTADASNFTQHTTAALYGIKAP